MKNITQQAQPEKAEYFSDFSGKKFPFPFPPVQVKLEFNYGSKFDGGKIEFDLTDEEATQILTLIRARLSQKTRREINKKLKKARHRWNGNFQARDWQSVDFDHADASLLQLLLAQEVDKKK